MTHIEHVVPTAARMQALGVRLATILGPGMSVYLQGELGSGKTTLARGILRGLGHSGAVPSPGYMLVMDYDCASFPVYHLDLYRLAAAAQAEEIGLRDYFSATALCLVEWPERLPLPAPALRVQLWLRGRGRLLRFSAAAQELAAALEAILHRGSGLPSGL